MHQSCWVELDLSALHANAKRLISDLDPQTKTLAVLKGDAYGVGIDAAVRTLSRAGVYGFAAGTVDEALHAKKLCPEKPVLIYGTYSPSQIPELAEAGLLMTAFSPECIARMMDTRKPLDMMIKVDCGFGRLGVLQQDMGETLDNVSRNPLVRFRGLYTHIGAVDDPEAVGIQAGRFKQAGTLAKEKFGPDIWLMAASSRVVLDHPELQFNMINPGRLLYGLLESPWRERSAYRPVYTAVKARLIQVKRLAPGRQFGYGAAGLGPNKRVGVVSLGFALGLPRDVGNLNVFVRGTPASIVGLAGMEQLVLNLSEVPDAAVEDEVVLFDSESDCPQTADSFAAALGLTTLEILPRLGRGLPRIYRGDTT